MRKVLVLYYSSYGHIEAMAYAQAEGVASVPGMQVVVKRVAELVPLERVLEPPFRRVPLLVRPEAILRTRRELGMGLQSEQAVQIAHIVDAPVDLCRDLLLGAEDVRVVLSHVANARQAMERSGELVSVQWCSLCVADR